MRLRDNIDFDSAKLQALANKLSLHFWNEPLKVPVAWNGRITRSMGRFVYRMKGKNREPVKIEMSKYAAQFVDREIFIAVLLHEMCHYHLFMQGKPFLDHQPDFEQELERVGAISTNTVKLPSKAYKLHCKQCKQVLGHMKRINPDRYRSPCCHSEILKEESWVGSFQYDGKILKHSKVNIVATELEIF